MKGLSIELLAGFSLYPVKVKALIKEISRGIGLIIAWKDIVKIPTNLIL